MSYLTDLNKPKDWTGIYSLDPSMGDIRFKNHQYLRAAPEEITITVRKDADRFEAAKQYLDEHHVPYTASEFTQGTSRWSPSHGEITIRRDMQTPDGKGGTHKLYKLIIGVMDRKIQQEQAQGRIRPEYVACAVHEALFGPLLIHPNVRAFEMGETGPINESIRHMLEDGRSPEEVRQLITTWIDCWLALQKQQSHTPAMGSR